MTVQESWVTVQKSQVTVQESWVAVQMWCNWGGEGWEMVKVVIPKHRSE